MERYIINVSLLSLYIYFKQCIKKVNLIKVLKRNQLKKIVGLLVNVILAIDVPIAANTAN